MHCCLVDRSRALSGESVFATDHGIGQPCGPSHGPYVMRAQEFCSPVDGQDRGGQRAFQPLCDRQPVQRVADEAFHAMGRPTADSR